MKHLSKKRAAVAGVVASLALGGGAFAYFTSSGTGEGTATVGDAGAWLIPPAVVTDGPMTPGGPEQTITYKVKNTGTGVQRLAKVTVKVAEPNGDAWTSAPGCSAADFEIGTAAPGAAADDDELAGDFTAGQEETGTIKIKMVDTGENQDGCKDKSVPLYLSAS